MKKMLSSLAIGLIVSTSAFATCCPPSVSSSCYNDFSRTSSRHSALRTCDNVADACYREFKAARHSSHSAVKACKNVSAPCFTQLRKEKFDLQFASNKC